MANRRAVRDALRLGSALLFSWMYIPHLLMSLFDRGGGQYILMYNVLKSR